MNSWGWFVIALGLIAVVMAVRNSLANLAPLVPGSGGTIGATGTTDAGSTDTASGGVQLAASGPGTNTNSRIVDVGSVNSLPTPAPLFPTPRVVAA